MEVEVQYFIKFGYTALYLELTSGLTVAKIPTQKDLIGNVFLLVVQVAASQFHLGTL